MVKCIMTREVSMFFQRMSFETNLSLGGLFNRSVKVLTENLSAGTCGLNHTRYFCKSVIITK
jgi:hypothetical protein